MWCHLRQRRGRSCHEAWQATSRGAIGVTCTKQGACHIAVQTPELRRSQPPSSAALTSF
jgi:hypothetical protein